MKAGDHVTWKAHGWVVWATVKGYIQRDVPDPLLLVEVNRPTTIHDEGDELHINASELKRGWV